jgi:hypothetical protein
MLDVAYAAVEESLISKKGEWYEFSTYFW